MLKLPERIVLDTSTLPGYNVSRVDLHNHWGEYAETVRDIGFDGVVHQVNDSLGERGVFGVTDFFGVGESFLHYGVFSNLPQKKLERRDLGNAIYVPEKDILVVRGEEIQVEYLGKELHLLVLGNPNPGSSITVGIGLFDALDWIRKLGYVTVIDHPFFTHGILKSISRKDGKLLDYILNNVDAIEVHNGSAISPGANRKAQDFYVKMRDRFPNLGGLISSDAHSLEEIATSFTYLGIREGFEDLKTPGDVIDMLRFAIRSSKNPTGPRKTNYKGAIRHAVNLVKEQGIKKVVERIS